MSHSYIRSSMVNVSIIDWGSRGQEKCPRMVVFEVLLIECSLDVSVMSRCGRLMPPLPTSNAPTAWNVSNASSASSASKHRMHRMYQMHHFVIVV